jgi:RNA polymerase sigma-70 factor (ECF subfamily)
MIEQRVSTSGANNQNALIDQARQGDRWAFGELVKMHQAGVIRVVLGMCGDPYLAEEAAQEAFIRAWQYLPRYKHRGKFRSWLYRIALNVALDRLRAEKETVDVERLSLTTMRGRPEVITERHERRDYVREAVLALPSASRSALILREYEGLSYQEIAETLNIPLGTVMSRLNYARQRLRAMLASYLEED